MMDFEDFIEAAQAFSDLGSAIGDQLKAVMEDGTDVDPAAINTHALSYYVLPFLRTCERFDVDTDGLIDTVKEIIDGTEVEDAL